MNTDTEVIPSMAMAVALGDTQVTIPADIDAAVEAAIALDKLATASTWAKASIVAAFVTVADGPGGDHSIVKFNNALSPTQFAAKGITGLKAARSVQRYARAWEISGHLKPSPGDTITLPDLDWSEVWSQVMSEMPASKPKADPIPDYFGDDGRKQAEDIASFEQVVASRPTGYDVDMPKNKLMSDTIGPDANNTVWADAVAEYEADPSKGFMGNPYATPETILKAIEKEDAAYARNQVAIDFLTKTHWVTFERLLQRGIISKQVDRDAMTDEQIIAGFDAQDPNDVAKIKKISVEDEEKAIECLRFLYRAARLYFNQ